MHFLFILCLVRKQMWNVWTGPAPMVGGDSAQGLHTHECNRWNPDLKQHCLAKIVIVNWRCSNWFISDFSGMSQSWCSPLNWRSGICDRLRRHIGQRVDSPKLAGEHSSTTFSLVENPQLNQSTCSPCKLFTAVVLKWKWRKGMRLYTIFVRETFRIMFAGKIEQFLLQKNCTHCLQYTSNKVSSVLIVSNVLIVSTPLSVQTIRLTHHNGNPP